MWSSDIFKESRKNSSYKTEWWNSKRIIRNYPAVAAAPSTHGPSSHSPSSPPPPLVFYHLYPLEFPYSSIFQKRTPLVYFGIVHGCLVDLYWTLQDFLKILYCSFHCIYAIFNGIYNIFDLVTFSSSQHGCLPISSSEVPSTHFVRHNLYKSQPTTMSPPNWLLWLVHLRLAQPRRIALG